MRKTATLIILVLLSISLSFVSAVPTNLDYSCSSDIDCSDICSAFSSGSCYCDTAESSCFYDETGAPTSTDSTSTLTTPNTAPQTTNPEELAKVQAGVSALEQKSASIEEKTQSIEQKAQTLDQRVTTLEGSDTLLKQQIDIINTNIQTLQNQQNAIKDELKGQVSSVATGLASAQKELTTTKTDLSKVEKDVENQKSFTSTLKIISFLLIILLVAASAFYFMNRHKKGSEDAQQEVVNYITKHIKLGKKYTHIKETLLNAGWAQEDIESAYKKTMNVNYQNYLQKQSGKSSSPTTLRTSSDDDSSAAANKNKMMAVGIVSVLLLIGVFFLIKGVTTGHAIAFQNKEQLNTAVKSALEQKFMTNPLFSQFPSTNLCIQVHDEDKDVSYQIIKTKKTQLVKEAKQPCDYSSKYDFAVKFNNWESFDYLSSSLSCSSAEKIHKNKGVYVLPSKYVLPGFEVNSALDLNKFCPLVSDCLSEEQLIELGMSC
jgi:hypothetical protein